MMPQSAIGAIWPPREGDAQYDNQAEKQDRAHGQSPTSLLANVSRGGWFLCRDPDRGGVCPRDRQGSADRSRRSFCFDYIEKPRLGVNRGLSWSTFVRLRRVPADPYSRGDRSVFLSILEWPPFPFGQL
jgi:hypothetical protein